MHYQANVRHRHITVLFSEFSYKCCIYTLFHNKLYIITNYTKTKHMCMYSKTAAVLSKSLNILYENLKKKCLNVYYTLCTTVHNLTAPHKDELVFTQFHCCL